MVFKSAAESVFIHAGSGSDGFEVKLAMVVVMHPID